MTRSYQPSAISYQLGAIILALATTAMADPSGRGELIYQQRCANCHVLGRGEEIRQEHKKDVDLTFAVKRHKLEWLRKWLQAPGEVSPGTPCRADRLERHEIDLILQLLQMRARPEIPATVPPRAAGPPEPRRPRHIQGPKAGGGG